MTAHLDKTTPPYTTNFRSVKKAMVLGGDELVHINVRVPEKLTPEERALMEKLSKEFEADSSS